MAQNAEYTQEQLDILKNVLADSTTDDNKIIRELTEGDTSSITDLSPAEDITEMSNIAIDPMTGRMNVTPEDIATAQRELEAFNPETASSMPESIYDMPVDENTLTEAMIKRGIKDLNIQELLKVMTEFKACKEKNKINWFKHLPTDIQNEINAQIASISGVPNVNTRKMFASMFLEGIASEAGIDQTFIDLQKSIDKMNDMANGIMAMHVELDATTFEVRIDEKIKILQDMDAEANVANIERLKGIKASYIESYRLTGFIDMARRGKLRVKPFDVEKYKRYVEDFNAKYTGDTPFIIHNISLTAPVLLRIFECFDSPQIMSFVIAFCKYTMNMDSHKVEDHTFMSYFIDNILKLDLVAKTQDEHAFMYELKNNLNRAIRIVNCLPEEDTFVEKQIIEEEI